MAEGRLKIRRVQPLVPPEEALLSSCPALAGGLRLVVKHRDRRYCVENVHGVVGWMDMYHFHSALKALPNLLPSPSTDGVLSSNSLSDVGLCLH